MSFTGLLHIFCLLNIPLSHVERQVPITLFLAICDNGESEIFVYLPQKISDFHKKMSKNKENVLFNNISKNNEIPLTGKKISEAEKNEKITVVVAFNTQSN